MRYFLLQLMLAMLAVSCAGCSAPANIAALPASSAQSVQASHPLDHSIRRVDFRNFTFDWLPAGHVAPPGVKSIALKDGEVEYDYHWGETPDFAAVSFIGLSYGEVTGDSVEDAVIVLLIAGPNNPRPCGVLAYTMKDGSPKLIWAHTSGGGSVRGLRDAYARDGQLVIEEYNPVTGEIDGKKFYLGSAQTYTRVSYEWDGRTFRPTGSEELPHEHDHPRYKPGPWHHEVGQQPSAPPP
jgi:hypothetical protein